MRRIESARLHLGKERKAEEHFRNPERQAARLQRLGIQEARWIEKASNIAEIEHPGPESSAPIKKEGPDRDQQEETRSKEPIPGKEVVKCAETSHRDVSTGQITRTGRDRINGSRC